MLPHFLLQSRQSLTLHKCLGRGVRVPWIGAAVRTGACPTSRRDHSHPLGAAPLHRPPAAPLHWPGAAPLHRPPAAPLHWPGAAPLHRPPAAPLHRPAAPLHWPGAAPLHWPGAAPLHWPGAAPLHWPPAAGRGLYTNGDPTFVFWAVSPFLLRPTIGPTPGAVGLQGSGSQSPRIGLTTTGAGRLRRLREQLRLALGSGRVDADIGSSGSGSVFARPGSRGMGRGHFTVRRGLGWPRDISLLGGGFNVGSHDRPDVQQQRQQRVRPPRIGLIIGGAGRLRRLRERLRRDAPWARPAVDRPVRPATTTA
ncbi:protein FAM210B, mitochondrial isoform X1 [Rhinoraja longicauda]